MVDKPTPEMKAHVIEKMLGFDPEKLRNKDAYLASRIEKYGFTLDNVGADLKPVIDKKTRVPVGVLFRDVPGEKGCWEPDYMPGSRQKRTHRRNAYVAFEGALDDVRARWVEDYATQHHADTFSIDFDRIKNNIAEARERMAKEVKAKEWCLAVPERDANKLSPLIPLLGADMTGLGVMFNMEAGKFFIKKRSENGKFSGEVQEVNEYPHDAEEAALEEYYRVMGRDFGV